jgi:hypothetical protein
MTRRASLRLFDKAVFADSRSTIKGKACSNDCRASEQAVADTQPY